LKGRATAQEESRRPPTSDAQVHSQNSPCDIYGGQNGTRGKAMADYPQDLAQDAVCQSHTGHMTGLWFLPNRL